MASCPTANCFPTSRFLTQGSYLGYGMYAQKATPEGNVLTNYWSDKCNCNSAEGATRTAPAGASCYGVKRQLTLLDIYGCACNPCANPGFCDSITDSSGTPHKPTLCGGTDPEVYSYSIQNEALQNVQGALQGITAGVYSDAQEQVLATRKKIFGVVGILILVMIVAYLIWKL